MTGHVEIAIVPKDEILRRIEAYRAANGKMSEMAFCKKVGIPYHQLTSQKRPDKPSNQFSVEAYLKLTNFFGMGLKYKIPKTAFVAGGRIIMLETPVLMEVEFPPGEASPSANVQLIDVIDNSCSPVCYRGDIIVIDNIKNRGVSFDEVPYFVMQMNGEWAIKLIQPAPDGLYNLTNPSNAADVQRNVEIKYYAEIKFIRRNYTRS